MVSKEWPDSDEPILIEDLGLDPETLKSAAAAQHAMVETADAAKAACDQGLLDKVEELQKESNEARAFLDEILDLTPGGVAAISKKLKAKAKQNDRVGNPVLFPRRAKWLRREMKERGLTNYSLRKAGGPESRTIDRILNGFAVHDDSLQAVLDGINRHSEDFGHEPVRVQDIPKH